MLKFLTACVPQLPALPCDVLSDPRDPFGRMLIVQAQAEGLILITADDQTEPPLPVQHVLLFSPPPEWCTYTSRIYRQRPENRRDGEGYGGEGEEA